MWRGDSLFLCLFFFSFRWCLRDVHASLALPLWRCVRGGTGNATRFGSTGTLSSKLLTSIHARARLLPACYSPRFLSFAPFCVFSASCFYLCQKKNIARVSDFRLADSPPHWSIKPSVSQSGSQDAWRYIRAFMFRNMSVVLAT